ncbi:MAG: MFS transporter [Myxococcota bacterium]
MTGLSHGQNSSDRQILYVAAFLRALSTGMVGVLIGIFLARRGFIARDVGMVVSAGLMGATVASVVVTLLGDQLGRRRVLVLLALLGAAGGLGTAILSELHAVVVAAFVGMVNGMGRDRGASLILDQVILPATAPDAERTTAFAWYSVVQDVGHALGGLIAGGTALLRHLSGLDDVGAARGMMLVYCVILLATAGIYSRLSAATETEAVGVKAPVSPETKRVLWRIASLFAVDSVAGGFLTAALLSFYFFERFGVSEGVVGALFFGARVANAASHLGAAWLAKRIGLLNTMVFTHIPSSLLLVTVALAPSFPVAACLFLLREGLVEMDVPTRQSYVMGLVRPEERTLVSGVTHLVRIGGWAMAPVFAGFLMQGTSIATPLFVGAGMKIAYDVLLYAAFRRQRPPEERG